MNNSKYIMVAETYLPECFKVERVRAEYRRSAVLGDTLHPVVYSEKDRMTVVLNDKERKPYAVIQFIGQQPDGII